MNCFKKNKIKILLSSFLILVFSNFSKYSSNDEFSFNLLKGKKIQFTDISMGNGQQIYDHRISSIVEARSKAESKTYKIQISKKYPIYHFCYDSIPNNNQENDGEYIQFYDSKVNINYLLKNNINKQVYFKETFLLFTGGIDFFEFKGNNFVLLSARDRRFFRNLERNYWVLLNVKNRKILKSFCFIDGYIEGKDCFGDFNNDGLLDYMNWDFLKDKIAIYSLNGNNFQIDKNHYVKMKQSKEQKEITKEQGIMLVYDLFDKKKSKWFYKL
ncbi:hypothetical protein PQ462_13120 [Flavobacterium sp. KACC 22758]|jgi:hypothetical protein|uniref:hypothetical protein n=1 Tax=Flavobacterium sp. KACC 22758 TaxID=3025667 RepID=UPI002366FBB0|nr:hypothetical protein [Flavobacterium sp. KACC 22758]WDF57659.1 hypothetical protein PQ462_13120 [Flavobacterium sp. KACC 22758]